MMYSLLIITLNYLLSFWTKDNNKPIIIPTTAKLSQAKSPWIGNSFTKTLSIATTDTPNVEVIVVYKLYTAVSVTVVT